MGHTTHVAHWACLCQSDLEPLSDVVRPQPKHFDFNGDEVTPGRLVFANPSTAEQDCDKV